MSVIGDYKLYKKYEPEYSDWKQKRDILNAKRLEYIKQHPEVKNEEDIQRARSLLRAIDVMDEYSQKHAEDMEVATEAVAENLIDLIMFAGAGLGYALTKFKPVENFLSKISKPLERLLKSNANKNGKSLAISIAGVVTGFVAATVASFPLMTWAAKTEVAASRKGRFEAMNKELDNPNVFAVLTPEQMKKAQVTAKNIDIKENQNKIVAGFKNSWNTVKDLIYDSPEYKKQRKKFLDELEERKMRFNDEMTEAEIRDAKRDQQLLTKIIEKIDIASQDYAENAELATQTLILGVGAAGSLIGLGFRKILNALKVKSAGKISAITNAAAILALVIMSIYAAQIQKHASKVGRFKVKQELMQNPEQLIYVDDKKAEQMPVGSVEKQKKPSFFNFLKNAWKDNKEYTEYNKSQGKEEKKLYKAIEKLKLNDEQIKKAEILQKNTFKTFNKIDENSQKYSESVEALGKSAIIPVSIICSAIGTAVAMISAFGKGFPKSKTEFANSYAKMFGIMLISTIPIILINAHITREQKKASRIADMMAIKELSDYREFRA